jgi:CHAT domain-containing protein
MTAARSLALLLVALLVIGGTSAAVAQPQSRLEQANAELRRHLQSAQFGQVIRRAREVLIEAERSVGPDHPEIAATLMIFARALTLTGDYARARPLYERAIAIRERAFGADAPEVMSIRMPLARLLDTVGDHAAAGALLKGVVAALERTRPRFHPQLGWALLELGFHDVQTGDFGAARPLLERALAIGETGGKSRHGFPPLLLAALNNLGFLHLRAGDDRAAQPVLERALAVSEQRGAQYTRVVVAYRLGIVAGRRHDPHRAATFYREALTSARKLSAPEFQWRAALALGGLRERAGALADAVALYREAVQTVERLAAQFGQESARAQYLESADRTAPYSALARALLRLHEGDRTKTHHEDAWAVLEARKKRMVAESLSAARPRLQDSQAQGAVEHVLAKQREVRAIEQAIREHANGVAEEPAAEAAPNLTALLARTKAEYLAQVAAFLARYPQYKTQFVDQQTIDPKALAKFSERLPAGTMAIQYFAAPDRLYLFVVAPGGRYEVRSADIAQEGLYGLVKDYRAHVERAATRRLSWVDDGSEAYRRDVAPLKALTQRLSDLLIGPVAADLGTHHDLVLIPNDLLLYLPFHALTLAGTDGVPRFLGETHAVSYVTQLELVDLFSPSRSEGDGSLLALANPDGTLPAATQEIRELRRLSPAVEILEGARATKARFVEIASRFRGLHLATHGELDARRPERSYLLMAGTDDTSQRLSVGEIAGLSLRQATAVLSACQTALGEEVPGAALVTLAAAFSQAGAEAVVASLWKVNDAATRDLMVAFHRALPTRGRAGALHEAQRAVLARPETSHPFYWASFILIGAR